MQDGKALQAGTSHFLAQNFAKAFDVTFLNNKNEQEYVWATSWGVSTRLMGALIMAHSDNNGLVIPPKLAPIQVVIVPIYKNNEQLTEISTRVDELINKLKIKGISCKYDNRDSQRPGFKFAEWELKGVPLRLAIGPKDFENKTWEVARRDTLTKEIVTHDDIINYIDTKLVEIQNNIFQKALKFRTEHTTKVDTWDEFKEVLETKQGFILAHWDGTSETEEKIKAETKATIRCIPINPEREDGKCVFSGKPSNYRVVFAKAY
jgi:prolyl-tRNA synthetase